jgi:hypothetical protein
MSALDSLKVGKSELNILPVQISDNRWYPLANIKNAKSEFVFRLAYSDMTGLGNFMVHKKAGESLDKIQVDKLNSRVTGHINILYESAGFSKAMSEQIKRQLNDGDIRAAQKSASLLYSKLNEWSVMLRPKP